MIDEMFLCFKTVMNKTQTDKSHELLPPRVSDAMYTWPGAQGEVTQLFRKLKPFHGGALLHLEGGERWSSLVVKMS